MSWNHLATTTIISVSQKRTVVLSPRPSITGAGKAYCNEQKGSRDLGPRRTSTT